ncbi:DUF2865 domain-containing protein [Methylobacterium gregans]|uniref:DUF2865 domain-containing protein n=1 Tax=Methylobacterium gregans TaxID=374424 RepID=A0AA37HKL9_9HYPH|nr:DUF2865 domain-containing protein [Methylobacterium gregans]MDQ0521743.1 hypothetical protein [Methylobacterium gregans]GJD77096.1 hypothetical protein NBEOAGPD_0298 [Methylobacterium gregans]GLS55006.1 hypothetical protein GCM10007886_31900 [Methylobacterium gregans]
MPDPGDGMGENARMWRGLAAGVPRRRLIGPLLAGLVLGLGGVTVAVSVGHAADNHNPFAFLEALFRGPPARPEPAPRQAARYVALPDAAPPRRRLIPAPASGPALTTHWRARREAMRRDAARHSTRIPHRVAEARAGRRTVCVRMCDGYLFPLGNLRTRADLPAHEAACAAACPGARTSLYTLAAGTGELDQAVSLQGQPYRASALAHVYRQRRVADCSCQAASGAPLLSIAQDPTLRAGDAVATRDSARVAVRLPGSLALVDYRTARIAGGARRQIEGRVGALQREARERAFRQVLRAAERESVVRVASAGGFLLPERAVGGFVPLRVVQPSPYGR